MKSWGNGREASSGKAAPYRDMQDLKAPAGILWMSSAPFFLWCPALKAQRTAVQKDGIRRAKRKGNAASLPTS